MKIFVPVEKLKFIFKFDDAGDLEPVPGGRGRNKRLFYSPKNYLVVKARQQSHGESGL